MKTTKPISLHLEMSATGQKAIYKQTFSAEVNGRKVALRIRIESDAYADQSLARLEIFNTTSNSWNGLASIAPGAMKTAKGLAYGANKGCDRALYAADVTNLLQQALAILEVAYA